MKQAPKLSYWEESLFFKDIDVLIIGSGIVGVSAAIRMKEQEPKAHVVIVERGSLPSGASTRNAGFACFGSMTELLDDIQKNGAADCRALVRQRWEGLRWLRQQIGDEALEYEEHGSYELFKESEEADYQACLDQLPAMNEVLAEITGIKTIFAPADEEIDQFGFHGVRHLIRNKAEGQLHPGKMMKALLDKAYAMGVRIYNGVEVESIQDEEGGVEILTAQGWRLTARQLLVATNGFARQLLPHLSMQPARNQVLLSQPIPNLPFKGCFHYDRGYYYFRQINNRLLLGGGRHLFEAAEYTDQFGLTEGVQAALIELARTIILPQHPFEIDRTWSGILGVGVEKGPIVEALSARLAVAVRMGGMGVAIGSQVGRSGADLLMKMR